MFIPALFRHVPPETAEYPLRIDAGVCSLQGTRRKKNEDSYYISSTRRLFIVADGIGGARAGAIASGAAVHLLADTLRGVAGESYDDETISKRMHDALVDANDNISRLAATERQMRGAGTTAVLALRRDNRLFVQSVGDSRAYHLRDGRIEQLTIDQTWTQALLKIGVITPAQARVSPMRHTLLSYLGTSDCNVPGTARSVDLEEGDRLLLCSDGLTESVDDDELCSMLSARGDPLSAAEALARLAVSKGAGDDVTCLTLFVECDDDDHTGEW